jgi:hypothetical protein
MRARQEVVDTSDVFITTSIETIDLTTPTHVPEPSTDASVIGAITLTVEEHLLASARY